MSLVEVEDVPDARSFCSTSMTLRPRPAASRAIPTPLMPPPTIARSNSAMALRADAPQSNQRSEQHGAVLWIRKGSALLLADDRCEMPYGNSRGQRFVMNFHERHIVVTGGTGALGSAVVGSLIGAGAVCHIPFLHDAEAERFPHRGHPNVALVAAGDLADEAVVGRLYAGVPSPWASIHLAGGFAAGAVADTGKDDLMRQLNGNFVSCFLCCRAAVKAMSANGGGRIVNVAARAALEWRSGAGMAAYAASKAAVAAMTAALAEEGAEQSIPVHAVVPP